MTAAGLEHPFQKMQLLSFEVQLPKSISGRIIETPQTFKLRYLKEVIARKTGLE